MPSGQFRSDIGTGAGFGACTSPGAGPYRPAAEDPETAELHHRGGVGKAHYARWVAIYFFEGNHRFSEKTPHPGPPSIVNAANLAASSRGSGDVLTESISAVCDPAILAKQEG